MRVSGVVRIVKKILVNSVKLNVYALYFCRKYAIIIKILIGRAVAEHPSVMPVCQAQFKKCKVIARIYKRVNGGMVNE